MVKFKHFFFLLLHFCFYIDVRAIIDSSSLLSCISHCIYSSPASPHIVTTLPKRYAS